MKEVEGWSGERGGGGGGVKESKKKVFKNKIR